MDTKVITTECFSGSKKPSILVVEDNEDNQLLLEYTIAMFGWNHYVAVDAIDAICFAKEKQPDLILLDIIMPDISGLQIACLLKNHIQTKNIPLIAVTGLVKREQQNVIFSVGFDDYISKPYALDDLHQTIILNLNKKDIYL